MSKISDILNILGGKAVVVPNDLLELVQSTLEENAKLREEVANLKDEIALLKGEKPRPTIKPSSLGQPKDKAEEKAVEPNQKRPGSEKRHKTAEIKIHKTKIIRPKRIPKGSCFKGYEDFVVQDLVIASRNILYRRTVWIAPNGDRVMGELPPEVQATGHFGPTLTSFILHQYHGQRVTEPRLLKYLQELEVDISSGQINRILTEDKEVFHTEKAGILVAGLEVSPYINVDDTGARHAGKNGYCTHIGNEFFTWFASTESKSRINFLELLRAGADDYHFCSEAYDYMLEQRLPTDALNTLKNNPAQKFANKQCWYEHLKQLGITQDRYQKIATEAALLGSVLFHLDGNKLVIISDDAGQFNVLTHALCWFHAERTINKLIPYTEENRMALVSVRSDIWDLYDALKQYKQSPQIQEQERLAAQFDAIFTRTTCFVSLNQALRRIFDNKSELLRVLERPEIPLHNNTSERDIREYVTKRKISGSTRSDLGRKARDTFSSLKKTALKLDVSFWQYLLDRVSGTKLIPQLGTILKQKALANSS